MPEPRPDLVVIGLDPAGLDLAMAAALIGARVAVVTQDESALDFAWRDGEMIARLGGWLAGTGEFARHRGKVERDIAIARSPERLGALGIRVIAGSAVFVSPEAIGVGEQEIGARRFVIGTGRTRPGGSEDARTLLGGGPLPASLAVSGGSAEAITLAQLARRLGASVNVVGDGLLSGEDPEAVELLVTALEREGIAFAAAAPAGAAMLALPPAVPDFSRLGLEAAGIMHGDGHLALSPGLGTTNRRVFAIGSAASRPGEPAGGAQQVPALFRKLILGFGGSVATGGLRYVATNPAIAGIGLTEQEAAKQGLRFEIIRQSLPGERGAGLIKLVTGKRERIVGVTIVHASAADLIAPWALALQNHLPAGRAASLPTPPSPLAEAARAAAGARARRALASPFLGRLARLMRLLP